MTMPSSELACVTAAKAMAQRNHMLVSEKPGPLYLVYRINPHGPNVFIGSRSTGQKLFKLLEKLTAKTKE